MTRRSSAPGSFDVAPEPCTLPQGLRLTGALDARAVPGAEAVLDGVAVDNAGWALEPLADDDGDTPAPPIRFSSSVTLTVS